MKKKRIVKSNPRRVQDTDIAIGERIRARRNQIEMSQEEYTGLSASAHQLAEDFIHDEEKLRQNKILFA